MDELPSHCRWLRRGGSDHRNGDPLPLRFVWQIQTNYAEILYDSITDPLAIYSGCYIRASINIYPFNANGNRGIAAGLSNIQFWEDGEPLNGRVRAEDEFDALDAEDDEDFLN